MTAKILVSVSLCFTDVSLVLVPDEFSFDGQGSFRWNNSSDLMGWYGVI